MGFFKKMFGSQDGSNNSADSKSQQTGTSASNSVSGNKPKRTPVSRSIDDIYGKGFRFVVDRYEEWANQRCTSQGELNGEIVAEIVGDRIVFTLSGTDYLNIASTVSMNLSNPMSRVLKSNGSPLVQSDRIQYISDNINGGNVPFLCHLFYENGMISYVRFAFTDPSVSSLMPITTRIYEFYGDMVELSETKKEKTAASGFAPFVFRSTCHQRYQSLMPVMGLQHCGRTVSVQKNISGCSGYKITPGDGYIVKLFNDDLGKPNMSDKPMRVKSMSKDLVVLQGYPLQALGPFGWMDVNYDEYGLDVHYRNGEIVKCVLHMYERDTYIEYMK